MSNPLEQLGRILAGVVLLEGRLGHQLLGQILILPTSDIEVAAASTVVAATANQHDAVAQVVLRTAAPAVAVTLLAEKEERRLERREQLTRERERQSDERAASLGDGARKLADAADRIAALERDNRELRRRLGED